MRKSLCATLLLLIVLVAGLAISVQAATVPTNAELIEIGTEAQWNEWFSGGTGSKLMSKVATSKVPLHIKITADITINGGEKAAYLAYNTNLCDIYLDLGGHTLTYQNTNTRWFGIYNDSTVTIFNGKLVNKASASGSNGAFCIMTKGHLVLEDLIYRDETTHTYTMGSKFVRVPAAATLTMNNVDMQINTQNNTKNGAISAAGKVTINNSTISVSETGKAVQGGMIYLDGGTTTINNSTLYGGMAQTGGMIYMTGKSTKLILNSGTIAGGTATGDGGNIYMDGGANLQIKGGVIKDGTAVNGGNICAAVIGTDTGDAYQTDIAMTGGTVTGGLAVGKESTNGGGNIALIGIADNTTQPKLTVTGGTIGGAMLTPGREVGTAYIGGNIMACYGCVDIGGNALISGGQATYLGGNIGYSRGTFNVTGGTITGGVCNEMGGNIGLSGTATKVNISGGEILDGYAPKGGNIYIAARSMPVNITGGLIANGRCLTNGGNICAGNGKLTITGGTITGGQAGNGGNIYVQSTGSSCLTTIGNCTITNGTARNYGDDIYVSASGKLKVKKTFAGSAYVFVAEAHLPQTEGGSLASANVACEGPFTGKLYLQNLSSNPMLYGLSDKKVYISTAATVQKDGSKQWFKNNAEMVAAYHAGSAYAIPAAGEVSLAGGTYTVDLQGKNINFTGSGSVTCFDSANSDYKTYGQATFNGVTLANSDVENIEGVNYCALQENGGYSFHRLDMKITSVSLRTRTAGIYYWADWDCDEALAKQISSYGIACRLDGMPTKNNLWEQKKTQRSVLYTMDGTEIFANPKENDETTGAIVNNILFAEDRTDANGKPVSNDTYGKTPIYAAPYVTLKNGTAVVAQQHVGYSLYDLVQQISEKKYTYAVYAKQLQQFFNTWEPYGINWALDFDVSEDIIHLESLYDGRTAYHGELHDHSNTGGTSDGKYTLTQWAEGMEKLGMDYAALLDHRQSLHMYLPEWDDTIFVGGTEAAGSIKDRDDRYNYFHYNMIFARPEQLESVLHAFPEYEFKEETEGELAGEWHFKYPSFTSARFNELITAVKEAGGFFAIPHPTGTEPQYTMENVVDHYWFQDETGWEVFYGNDVDNSDYWFTRQNYAVWIELLKAGKRLWVTSGNDDHEMPATTCLNTIYSTEGRAQAHIDQLRVGNFTAGPVGIKMCIGDTQMGGQCDFTGQRLVFCIGDIHESAWKEGYTYTVNLWKDEEVVSTWTIDGVEDFYYATDVDATAEYYRIEIYNKTLDRLIALGNPIWNLD